MWRWGSIAQGASGHDYVGRPDAEGASTPSPGLQVFLGRLLPRRDIADERLRQVVAGAGLAYIGIGAQYAFFGKYRGNKDVAPW